jgi:hypothetical protein
MASTTFKIFQLILLLGLLAVLLPSRHDQSLNLDVDESCQKQSTMKGISLKRVGLHPSHCGNASIKIFDKIYQKGSWGGKMKTPEYYYGNGQFPPEGRLSPSGRGSNLGYAVNVSIDFLRRTIRSYNITSMIDLPCGDANWIFDSWETDSLDAYIGLDIVTSVIALNQKRFEHHSNKLFELWDGTICALPKYYLNSGLNTEPNYYPVDLIHSRDVLQHLKLSKAMSFLCHIMNSGARVLITTTFPSASNKKIRSGLFFHNNLDQPPFSMPRNESNCVFTHPDMEPDLTCVYDLTSDWVRPWVQRKCL